MDIPSISFHASKLANPISRMDKEAEKTMVDVPSPVDLRLMADAREWEHEAMSKRPWRTAFFDRLAAEAGLLHPPARRMLELGSGPGFLAVHMLQVLPQMEMVLLDFSSSMHQLALDRLGKLAERASFVERSFKDADWPQGMGVFDCIVTIQAVHELRHKRHATALHAQARSILTPGGAYLVCDHFAGEGGMRNGQLFMSVAEQKQALLNAGFRQAEQIMLFGGMILHRAE